MKEEIKLLEENEVRDFENFKLNKKYIKPSFPTVNMGLLVNDHLIAFARFSSVTSSEEKTKFTGEIHEYQHQKTTDEAFVKIVEYYKTNFTPADLIFKNSSKSMEPELVKSGFTKIENQWGWFNPNLSFYTYKITSPKSSKYYYGVRQIKIPKATIQDCLDDPYYGSGRKNSKTNKFSNWKNKHKETLQKEIIEIFTTKAEAYNAEKKLIGDSWKTDENCLNSTWGGLHGGIGLNAQRIELRKCPNHGNTKHIGETCYKCLNEGMYAFRNCEKHGEAKHRGETCIRCSIEAHYELKECMKHGVTKHYSNRCSSCHNENSISLKTCRMHGETKHVGEKCYKCIASGSFNQRECEVHGETTFRGISCVKCSNESSISVLECSEHGLAKFRKGKCLKCQFKNRFKLEECSEHGVVLHYSGSCKTCSSYKRGHNIHHKDLKRADCKYCLEA